MKKLLNYITVLILFLFSKTIISQVPLYNQVLVSDVGARNNIGSANTSRNIAINEDGIIYVAFTGSLGIRVAKSTDRGQSFLPSVLVSDLNSDPEIIVNESGIIFISWIQGNNIMLSRSTDSGQTFSTGEVIGAGIGKAPHMAIFGNRVHIVDQIGQSIYTNTDNGIGDFNLTKMSTSYVYADIRTDINGIVYVPTDDPNLYLFESIDNGFNFTPISLFPQASVFFSSYALSDSPNGTFIFVGGGSIGVGDDTSSIGYKIDVSNGQTNQITLGENEITPEGRTLFADNFGALVDGFRDSSGNLLMNISYNQGESFPISIVIANGESHNIDRNPLHDDLNVAYEQNGQVYMNVYDGLLRSIKIIKPETPYSFCKSETFELPYSLSGNFDPNSIFEVYLSDENGNFENKILIGSINANISGTISSTIPNNIGNSSNYRIQIQSASNFIQSNIINVEITSPNIASSETIPNLTYKDNTSFGTNTDGFIIFNLTERENDILEGQSSSDFQVTYYIDEERTIPIISPSIFLNTIKGEQIIYVNVVSNINPGCYSKTHFNIKVKHPGVVFPKFFTPNNDQNNDFWKIENIDNDDTVEIIIFDRYGKFLAQVNPKSLGWDGTYNGAPLPANEYWFMANYIDPIDNTIKKHKGHFVLKR